MKFRLSVIGFFFVVAVLAVQLCAQLTGDTVTVPSFLKKEKKSYKKKKIIKKA